MSGAPNPGLPNQVGSDSGTKTRKSRGKSRFGCMRCKEKRVKCDEVRPACSRCLTNRHGCVYSGNAIPKWNSQIITFTLPTASRVKASVSESSGPTILNENQYERIPLVIPDSVTVPLNQSLSTIGENHQTFDAQDIYLLIHFISNTSTDLIGDQNLWVDTAVPLALQHNFLMHAILTLSASHLQKTHGTIHDTPPHNYQFLKAHHLQKALSAFNDTFLTDIHAHQDAVLATSFLLFFHACSVVDTHPLPTGICEDASFTFLRGIRSIVIDRPRIAHSGRFKSLVAPPHLLPVLLPSVVPFTGPGVIFMNLLNSLPLGASPLENRAIYIDRIESLTLYLSTAISEDLKVEELEELLLCFIRWQVFCPARFVALIVARDSIALILLAHYYGAVSFILSKIRHKWWWWQDKPSHMVQAISEYLGSTWAAWMEWPMAIVQRHEKQL